MNFDLLTPSPGSGGGGVGWRYGGLRATYLLLCCCILDSLQFNIQHVLVLKKLNFDPLVHPRCETQAFDRKSRLICFIFFVPLSACKSSVKIL